MNLLVFLIFSIISISSFSQKKNTISNEYSHFQVIAKKDTIDFIVADTNLTVKKPLLLFCQGSQPVPLFFDLPNEGIVPVTLSNFDVNEMKKHYHVVVISMPKTPVIVGLDHLNKSYNYVLDTAHQYSYSPDYVKADYLDNYVQRANYVLQYLSKQKWVDKKQLVVAGHSQGSHIALEIACANKKVTQLGLFGFNPLGRIDQYIRKLRKQAEANEITWQEADSIQLTVLNDYASYFKQSSDENEDYAKSWVSFSKSQVSKLIEIKIPIYIANGSNDINGDFCDLIPLYYIEQGKTNYKIIRYPNLEHNFFPIDNNGEIDYQNGKWKTVMNEFIKWSLN
jgi:dienelactone hydrolase